MQYREFGKDKRQVSALGFGCMRLPTTNGLPNGPIDEAEATRMVRRGIDAGINYLDSAKVYHEGKADAFLGKALAGGYREKVMIATKLPLWDVTDVAQCEKMLEEQLRDLKTDSIDVYLFHSLQQPLWQKIKDYNLLDWAEKKRQEGKIQRLGFSFHDNIDLFREIVETHDWDMCMIQYNYITNAVQAGTEGLKYAKGKGLSVVVMEPLFGGVLAEPIGKMKELFEDSPFDPADLALRWVWDQPEVSHLLSGMSSMSQLEHNLEIANRSGIGGLTQEERDFIETLRAEYEKAAPIKCTKCRYCLPCPSGVDIPENFDIYNNLHALPKSEAFDKLIYQFMPEEKRASSCTDCGTCEGRCPQQLPIRELLKKVHALLS